MSKPSNVCVKEEPVNSGEFVKERTWKDSTWYSVMREFFRNKTSLFGFCVICILVFCAVFAPLICKYSPSAVSPMDSYQSPNADHWFGTDNLGRDLFARIMYGGRYSLSIGVGAALLSVIAGIILGTIAGYFGGIVDNIILRICDVVQNIPYVLLCIVVAAALGNGFIPTLIALAIISVPGIARLLRASMLSVRGLEFVEAAKATNCSTLSIMFKHVLPNSMAPIIVAFSMGLRKQDNSIGCFKLYRTRSTGTDS